MSITIGEELPTQSRETGFANWNRYAAVNHEFVPIHMDDEAGRAAGYDGAFGMGNLQWAYLHNVVRDWIDGRGRIVAMSCQFRGANTKGLVVSHGVVADVREEAGTTLVDVDVWTDDGADRRLATGRATVEIR